MSCSQNRLLWPEAEECRSHPVWRLPIGGSEELVYSMLSKEGRVLDRFKARLLGLTSSFAPLAVHADRLAKSSMCGDADQNTILGVLHALAIDGLLLSRSGLMDRVVSQHQSDPPPQISWLAVPTCNRPELLRRCVQSFGCHFRKVGRFPRLLIADDSDTPDARVATKAVVDDASRNWLAQVVYFGLEKKQALIKHLVKEGGLPESTLVFGILGPGGAAQGAGANRNAILLRTLGDLVLSVDDDTTCQAYANPGPVASRLRIGGDGDPSEYWFFQNRQSAIDFVQPIGIDVLSAHEIMLGKHVHSLIGAAVASDNPDLSSACGHLISSLWEGSGRVLITANGSVGDSGMYSGRNFPIQKCLGTRSRLFASEDGYHSALRSREVLRQPLMPTISHGASLISMFFGMDNRSNLPPFFPIGHCDDGVFAVAVNRCLEGCYFGYLPWALMHDPSGPRTYFDRFATTVRVSDIVSACISSWSDSDPYRTSSDHICALGRHLENISACSVDNFREYIRFMMWQRAAQRIGFAESLLNQHGAKPDFWSADLLRERDQILTSLLNEGYCEPVDLPSAGDPIRQVQDCLLQYGRLLSHWPMIEEVCRRSYDFND